MNAAEVEGRRADAEQVIVNAHQLGEDGADVLAARRQLDAQQLLDGVVPGDLVGDRRDVVHPIDDGDVLVEVEVFAELLEATVQVADVGHRLDDRLAVEGEEQAQRGVRGRVLRAEVERPEVLLLGDLVGQRCRAFPGAWRSLRISQIADCNVQIASSAMLQSAIASPFRPRQAPGSYAARPGRAADSPCAAGNAVNSSGIRMRRRSGMAVEHDAVHVVDLALHPVGPLPQREGRRQRQVRVVQERLHVRRARRSWCSSRP